MITIYDSDMPYVQYDDSKTNSIYLLGQYSLFYRVFKDVGSVGLVLAWLSFQSVLNLVSIFSLFKIKNIQLKQLEGVIQLISRVYYVSLEHGYFIMTLFVSLQILSCTNTGIITSCGVNLTLLCLINLILATFFYVVNAFANRNFRIIANNIVERRKFTLYYVGELLLVIIIIISNYAISQ